MFGFKIVRIIGDSMSPGLPDSTYAVFRKASVIRVNDTVLVDHPTLGLIVKDVCSVSESGLRLKGRNALSTSSEQLGRVPNSAFRGRLVSVLS